MSVRWRRFGDLFQLERRDPGLRMGEERAEIGIRSFGRGTFHKPPVSTAELGGKRVFEIREGDLLISNIFAWEGAIAVAGQGDDRLIGSHRFMTWTPTSSSVNVSFVREYLLSTRGLDAVSKASPGSAGRNRTLGVRALEEIEIPVPDLPTQRAIAARLDAVASSVIAPKSGGLGDVARQLVEGACLQAPIRPFGELFELVRRPARLEEGRSYREIGVRSFGRGLFVKEPVTAQEIGAKRVFEVVDGDLVISNIFAWEGAVGLARSEHDGLLGSHRFMTWIPRSKGLSAAFARFYLTSVGGVEKLRDASPGSAGRNRTLAIRSLQDLRIPVPSLRAQNELVRRMESVEQLRGLASRRQVLVNALLPAARNEEFARLLAT
ncbi:restriction endonuclease subunit S [Cellulosimicrobium cellulans]|uniref:Type I restriction modification DNA specificity domain-containing protein n=1 Tax=Cellulosimicrobium cellulans TaxID=1710 RepID=A0A4Y4DW47_CELCE|nr:restriction endonuclease subunit S [Cellulosimicrobium cellulans]GED08933.1 hypothetical protein CCE02nite_09320 [Cellulosimicrobium cellulans]